MVENGNNKVIVQEESKFTKILFLIDRFLLFIEDKATIVCFIIMTVAVLYGVVMRFILRLPNQYGEEVSRYFMVMCCFLGIGLVERENGNMKIDIITNLLPETIGRRISFLARILTIIGYTALGVLASRYVGSIYSLNQVSTALKVPMYIIYSFVMVGFYFGGFHAFVNLWGENIDRSKISEKDNNITES